MAGFIRSPKTHQEMAAFEAAPVELVRRKRSPALLPTSWTDIFRRTQRCWKAYRLNQWRTTR
jgi:hypothetical protein